MNDYDVKDQLAMRSVIDGQFVSQIARTLAEMRVPDLLHDGPKTAQEIAETASTHEGATFRLLRCAVFAGFATYDETTSRFVGTSVLDRLRSDAPDTLRSLAIAWGSPGHWRQWGLLPEVVRTGEDQSFAAHGKPLWEYFAEQPAEASQFAQAVVALSEPVVRDAVTKIAAKPGDTIVDVGGSTGSFVLSMLKQHPGTVGIVHDLPHVMDDAKQEIAKWGMTERCTAEPGDFVVEVPQADIYLLKFILHDWDDDACVALLEQCRRAMRPGGRVVVVDMLIGPPAEPGSAALMDINMLAMLPGREHDLDDLDRLFAAAELRRTTTTALPDPHYAIEAVAV